MKLQVGDTVRFLDDEGGGVITEILSDVEVKLEDDSGFDYAYPVANLVKIENHEEERKAYESTTQSSRERLFANTSQEERRQAEEDFKISYKNKDATTDRRRGEKMEVDLHIHEIIDNTRGLENADMVDIQMKHFERMMGIAEQKKVARIIFIHGVGQGILRGEIRNTLEQYYPNTSYRDADYREYGYGATEVEFRRN